MSDDLTNRVAEVYLTPEEVRRAIKGAEPDAPLPERLRNPRTPYRPVELREEAAAHIEALERERDDANADAERLANCLEKMSLAELECITIDGEDRREATDALAAHRARTETNHDR